ncbi:MAG: hypothetical protein M3N08_02655 [Pseudomonadota bacterium]|nr:hypothetical protein [Pseudomonadota bacterium]
MLRPLLVMLLSSVLGLGFSDQAFAADSRKPVPPADQEADRGLCQALTKHVPDANVAYQPGLDVKGRAVAPADLPGSPQMQTPRSFNIPVTLELAKVLNLDTTVPPFGQLGPTTEATVGTLTIAGDKVLFNGQPISDTQQDNLAVLCLKKNGK